MSGAPFTPLRVVAGSALAARAPRDMLCGHHAGPPALSFGAVSRGGPRNASNQDRHLVVEERGLFAVLDGMGGHRGGDLASALAANSLHAGAHGTRQKLNATTLSDLLAATNHRLYAYGLSRSELRGMGATVALLRLRARGGVIVLHAGDCRVYCLRNYRLRQLTRDHAGAALNDLGQATAERRTQRGVTRALGARPQLVAEITRSAWQAGDIWLVTSDGVTDVLPEYALTNLLVASDGTPRAMANAIISAAVEAGSSDDATAVVVKVGAANDAPREPVK